MVETLKPKVEKNQHGNGYTILDIWASKHVLRGADPFRPIMEVVEVEVEIANVGTVKSKHKSKILADFRMITVVLSTLHFISTLQLNLLSSSCFDNHGSNIMIWKVTFTFMDKYHNNDCLGKIWRGESDVPRTVNIIKPRDNQRTRIYSMSDGRKSFISTETVSINNFCHKRIRYCRKAAIEELSSNSSYCS